MAEVEKVTTSTVAATAAADIPVTSIGGSGADAVSGTVELGTSPTQERSSNSHPHDSEYDTASDLEGGEDYEDEDDDLDHDDDSMTDGESMTDYDDEDVENDGPVAVGGAGQEKVDAEAQKKVDEDRSNPQYIPKRGTFYEHDDRTAEGEAGGVATAGDGSEAQDGSLNGANSPQSPDATSSQQASKTMKKWQQASGVECWSHDRFDASEQAPKSRSELVNSYGYDIRTEDAPPKARRRRRYGRGPSKYSRNWEDENAYLKASNKDRKPPRPSDFPALNERAGVVKDRKKRITRDEKENRVERRQMASVGANAIEKPSGIGGPRPVPPLDDRSRDSKVGDNKNKGYSRQNAPVGRQAAMEFKQKQRSGQMQQTASSNNNSQNNRNDYQRQSNRPQNSHFSNEQQQLKLGSGKGQSSSHQRQPYQNDSYNHNSNGKVQDLSYQQQMQSPQQQHQPQSPMSMRQPQQPQPKTTPTSNLSQRLQQVQNRNDPSHVGSIQMHALATQNQMVGQQQQQAASLLLTPQQQGQIPPQEQRGPPKRYSSLRRSQHEAQHITEQHQHQLQQLHLQQQQQQQQPLILQDQQHMIQANLMQLYRQENIQAQMQALQVNQSPGQPKQTAYGTVPPAAQSQPQPYGATAGTTATPAYYVAASEAYAPTAAGNTQAPPAAQYAPQQPPPNYLAPSQTAVAAAAATLAYSGAPPSAAPQPVVAGAGSAAPYGPTSAVPAAVTSASTVPQTTANANPNYTNYQNYNTVGGTTYFVPPAQATTRPVVLPQRRPTNAIPILPPSEKSKQRANIDIKDEKINSCSNSATPQSAAPIGSAENIDHILDNMFVQRPAFQPAVPPSRKSSSPSGTEHNTSTTSGNGSSGGDSNSSPTTQQPDDTTSPANSSANSTTINADKMSNSIDGIGVAVENSNVNNAVTGQE